MTGVQKVSARVEELLESLKAGGFGRAAPAAEELVGLLVGLYGDGLAQIATILAESGPGGAAMLARLADDPLVESLLLLHGLHPLDVDARIQRALDRVRPYLGSHAGGVEYLGVAAGVARLKLEGSCSGCPSSTVTVQLAIEGAVLDAAPEVTSVVVEGMTPAPPAPALLQIGRRPDEVPAELVQAAATGQIQAGNGVGWVTLPNIGPPSSRPVSASADGLPVIVCSVRGTLYAYRDGCAGCGSSLAEGELDREVLTCPGCGARYNVRLAGKSVADAGSPETGVHLDPLPLLADSQGVRVAVPEVVPT
ncbi:MAG TPA: NifU family protein [Streptosporangiaceae bacterium]|nr:NifU family protein [Streptosporangiaceae bacterium]